VAELNAYRVERIRFDEGGQAISERRYRYSVGVEPREFPTEANLVLDGGGGGCGIDFQISSAAGSTSWTASNCSDLINYD